MMASSGTPTKLKAVSQEDVASPSAKRALDFDFWAERQQKKPKIVEEDLKQVRIKDLDVTKCMKGILFLHCSSIGNLSNVLKLACDDGYNKITVTAFGGCAGRLRQSIKVNDIIALSNFGVKKENFDYRTGTFQDLEIIFNECSKFEIKSDCDFPAMPYEWKTIPEVKALPDSTVVDVLAVVAKNWGVTTTSRGTRKLDVSLTDSSKETVRLTLWEEMADQLVGFECQTIAISRAIVSSFQGTKMLTSKWHTSMKVNPNIPDAEKLFEWFMNETHQ